MVFDHPPDSPKTLTLISLLNRDKYLRVFDGKISACESMQKTYKWAGLDSNQRKLTLMGLQPIPFSSQPSKQQALTTLQKDCVQTSVQTKTKNDPKQTKFNISELPSDLAKIVAVWPSLPENIKAAIKALIQTHNSEIK